MDWEMTQDGRLVEMSPDAGLPANHKHREPKTWSPAELKEAYGLEVDLPFNPADRFMFISNEPRANCGAGWLAAPEIGHDAFMYHSDGTAFGWRIGEHGLWPEAEPECPKCGNKIFLSAVVPFDPDRRPGFRVVDLLDLPVMCECGWELATPTGAFPVLEREDIIRGVYDRDVVQQLALGPSEVDDTKIDFVGECYVDNRAIRRGNNGRRDNPAVPDILTEVVLAELFRQRWESTNLNVTR